MLGPQGAGKGTQAEALSTVLKAKHISSGDLIRHEIREGTDRGKQLQSYTTSGKLAPDSIVLDIMGDALAHEHSWILDGFPVLGRRPKHSTPSSRRSIAQSIASSPSKRPTTNSSSGSEAGSRASQPERTTTRSSIRHPQTIPARSYAVPMTTQKPSESASVSTTRKPSHWKPTTESVASSPSSTQHSR